MKVLQIQEQGINISNENIQKNAQIEIGVAPLLLVRKDEDTFGLLLKVLYRVGGNEVILDYDLLTVFAEENWKAVAPKEENALTPKAKPIVSEALSHAIDGLRAALAVRLTNTKLEGLVLPMMPAEEVLANLRIRILNQ